MKRVMPQPRDLGTHIMSSIGQPMFSLSKWKEDGSPVVFERTVMGYQIPLWQRPFVWTDDQKIKLIESIWLGLNIGTYTINRCYEEDKLDHIVIDGQQRLKSIEDYLNGKFPVFNHYWYNLEKHEQRKFHMFHFHSFITQTMDETYLKSYYNLTNFSGVAHTTISGDDWKAVEDMRGVMADLRDFCRDQNSLTGDCCIDPEAECPIAMGEYWTDRKQEIFKRVSDALFPEVE